MSARAYALVPDNAQSEWVRWGSVRHALCFSFALVHRGPAHLPALCFSFARKMTSEDFTTKVTRNTKIWRLKTGESCIGVGADACGEIRNPG